MMWQFYLFFELILLALFITSFYTKQILLWTITLVLGGIMMFTSYDIGWYVYQYNFTTEIYVATVISHSYPYLMAVNLIFFVLALVLGIFDMFDQYILPALAKGKAENER